MDIVVFAETKPGLSITIMGEIAKAELESRGHTVEIREVKSTDRIDNSPSGLGEINGKHLLFMKEHKAPSVLSVLRYQRPKSLLSVYVGNMEDKMELDTVSYLAAFASPPIPMYSIPHSMHTHNSLGVVARKWFSPSTVNKIRENTVPIPYGIENDFVAGQNDPTKMIAPFNRLVPQKQPQMHAECLALYQSKYPELCKLWHAEAFPPDPNKADLSVYDVEVQYADRQQFKDELGTYGMFLCTASFESFGIYYLELLASGLVGVFLDRPWVRRLIPEYPFLAEKDDLVPLMMWIRENYEEAKAQILDSVEKHLQYYTTSRFYDEIEELMLKHDEVAE